MVRDVTGFIGSNFALDWLSVSDEPVGNRDKLTYPSNLENLAGPHGATRHILVNGDLGDRALVDVLSTQHRPHALLHFTAENHLNRAIQRPKDFNLQPQLSEKHRAGCLLGQAEAFL
jgi:dTDP-glucose 4,6-dehydratase